DVGLEDGDEPAPELLEHRLDPVEVALRIDDGQFAAGAEHVAVVAEAGGVDLHDLEVAGPGELDAGHAPTMPRGARAGNPQSQPGGRHLTLQPTGRVSGRPTSRPARRSSSASRSQRASCPGSEYSASGAPR